MREYSCHIKSAILAITLLGMQALPSLAQGLFAVDVGPELQFEPNREEKFVRFSVNVGVGINLARLLPINDVLLFAGFSGGREIPGTLDLRKLFKLDAIAILDTIANSTEAWHASGIFEVGYRVLKLKPAPSAHRVTAGPQAMYGDGFGVFVRYEFSSYRLPDRVNIDDHSWPSDYELLFGIWFKEESFGTVRASYGLGTNAPFDRIFRETPTRTRFRFDFLSRSLIKFRFFLLFQNEDKPDKKFEILLADGSLKPFEPVPVQYLRFGIMFDPFN